MMGIEGPGTTKTAVSLEFRLPDDAPASGAGLARAVAALAVVVQRREGTERVPVAWRGPDTGGDLRHAVLTVSPGLRFDVFADQVHDSLRNGIGEAQPVALEVEATEDPLCIRVPRTPAGYSTADSARLLSQAGALLSDAARRPHANLGELVMTGPDEAVLTRRWGAGRPVGDRTGVVPDRIADQARRRPDAAAVVCGDTVLSYGELHRRARALATRLVSRGVSPESLVAVRADRSPELMVALLGVLMAGGAYLALDPEQPRDRIGRLLADARPALILASRDHLPGLPAAEVPVIELENELAAAEDESAADRLPGIHPAQLAYVSYTSGSTGEPKGVAVPHGAVARLVDPDWASYGPADVFLQIAPVAFDASTFEIWTCLVHGAMLAVYPPGRITPELLAETVRRHGVTVLSLTAGLFHQVADTAPEVFTGVRRLIAGGDVVSAAHVRSVLRAHPGLSFTHAYGPTENTTFTTVWTTDGPPQHEHLPIGGPIRGTGVAILDESLRPVPVGVVGELFAAGAGLARGYLRRPAATAERFLPDPRPGAHGARMYRTGDLARWSETGEIEFLGRADTQVKIRGYRVELGEVEARLREFPGVRDAVAVVRTGPSGERELAAYLVPAEDAEEPVELAREVRRLLGESLPSFMIPHRLYAIDTLPLNVNGKVDRAALGTGPGVRELGAGHSEHPAAPGTELERTVAAAWRDVLGRDAGLHDNFFEAGGDSLLLLRLRARLAQLLGRKVATVTLFSHPTIHGLAEHLAGETAQAPSQPGGTGTRESAAQGRQALRDRARRLGAGREGR